VGWACCSRSCRGWLEGAAWDADAGLASSGSRVAGLAGAKRWRGRGGWGSWRSNKEADGLVGTLLWLLGEEGGAAAQQLQGDEGLVVGRRKCVCLCATLGGDDQCVLPWGVGG
jgi:hypothetical protein